MPLTFAHPGTSSSHEHAAGRLQHNCYACGFQNLAVDMRCQKCGRRLPPIEGRSASAVASSAALSGTRESVQAPAPALIPQRPAMPEHVRHEIHSRVEKFRARRLGQTLPLPFEEQVLNQEAVVPFPTLEADPPVKNSRARANRAPKISPEIPASNFRDCTQERAYAHGSAAAPTIHSPESQPIITQELAASQAPLPTAAPIADAPAQITKTVAQFPLFIPPSEQIQPEWQNFQIAALGKRLHGIGTDLTCILSGVLLYAAPFYWIAGKPPFNLHLLAGFVAGTLLIALLFGTLFLVVFGETPGMTAAGLRIVSFNGQPATPPQRLLRVAGALVSCGSFLFGYLWAFVDEEHLYWHDHISKTVLTDSCE